LLCFIVCISRCGRVANLIFIEDICSEPVCNSNMVCCTLYTLWTPFSVHLVYSIQSIHSIHSDLFDIFLLVIPHTPPVLVELFFFIYPLDLYAMWRLLVLISLWGDARCEIWGFYKVRLFGIVSWCDVLPSGSWVNIPVSDLFIFMYFAICSCWYISTICTLYQSVDVYLMFPVL
jgi:hypothetical protein